MSRAVKLVLALSGLVMLLTFAKAALEVPVPTKLDERAHYSYVEEMAENPRLFIDHGSLRMFDRETLSQWTDTKNYLSHPPLYYLLMAPFAPAERGPDAIITLRLVNAVATAVILLGLMIVVARRMTSLPAILGFCVIIAFTPSLVAVSGSVNNDSLATISGMLALTGWVLASPWIMAGALALSGWVKATNLMEVGIFLMLVHGLHLREIWSQGAAGIKHLAILTAGGLLAGLPYLWSVWKFGTPFYVDVAYHALGGKSATLLEPGQFIDVFLTVLMASWSAPDLGPQLDNLILPPLILALGGWAMFRGASGSRRLAAAAILTLPLVLLPHLYFAYDMHQKTHDISMAQFRYYLPLVPIWAYCAGQGLAAIDRNAVKGVLIAVMLALLAYGWVPVAMLRKTMMVS